MTETPEMQINKLEEEIRESKKMLATLRSRAPVRKVNDYAFTDSFGKQVLLSELFGKRKELFVVHNMGTECAYCTLWADGFNGMLKHLESRAAFVVSSPDDPCTQRRFSNERGWQFKMVSTAGTSFRKDMGFQGSSADVRHPGISVFTQVTDGEIYQVADASFGPGDNYCSFWDLLDLLPSGKGDWEVELNYFKGEEK